MVISGYFSSSEGQQSAASENLLSGEHRRQVLASFVHLPTTKQRWNGFKKVNPFQPLI
ncbi:hypothetical protein IFO70_23960 [Phormidium tenue FACHB-886]|nr:hypothetical protein [Phormidium tenue FACHB-886]